MITAIFGDVGAGKTALLTHFAREIAFDRARTRLMINAILTKRANGFENLRTIPPHCVSANFDMTLRKFGYSPRYNRLINPYELGFFNPLVKTHFNLPYEAIFISEAQRYLNSRKSFEYPDWQSRWYEMHRHNDLDIFLDIQRPMLIDINVRSVVQRFIHVVDLKVKTDEYGKVCGLKWTVRIIENNGMLQIYLDSGNSNKSCYTESTITADYNVFDCYESKGCEAKFYEGHFDEDFDYTPALPLPKTVDGFKEYLQRNNDELPENFYTRGNKKKC